MILGRFRFWNYGGVIVEIPPDTPYDTPRPKTLAEVPEDWPRRPVDPPKPRRR